MKSFCLAIALVLGAVACTKTNPAVCCNSETDCESVGLPDGTGCTGENACVDHACLPAQCGSDADCATPTSVCTNKVCVACDAAHGCSVAAPVCELDTATCGGCTGSADCAAFPTTPLCDSAGGACVQCLGASDCGGTSPVCDSSVCRGCKTMGDCGGQVCDPSGACVDPLTTIYLAPTGTDAGTCTAVAPCKTIAFAATLVSASRTTISLAMGDYTEPANVMLMPPVPLVILGNGATVHAPMPVLFSVLSPVTIENLTITGPGFAIDAASNGVVLDRISVINGSGITLTGNTTVADLTMSDITGDAITLINDTLTLDRAILTGVSGMGINGQDSLSAIHAQNLVILNAGSYDLFASGTLSFSTLIGGANLVQCGTPSGGELDILESILWETQGHDACHYVNSIEDAPPGNSPPGTVRTDPMLDGYHLTAASTAAIDKATSGPATDFEGDARPMGNGYDLGADEFRQ